MTDDDLDRVLEIRSRAFAGLPGDTPPPPPGARPGAADWWSVRTRHLIATGRCVVAQEGEHLVGFATSLERAGLWVLATFAVDPERHAGGVGRALLDAVDPGGRAMLSSSVHAGALRTYHRRGFRMMPMVRLSGTVRRERLPAVVGVRTGDEADLDLLDAVDRRVRGSDRRIDHELMLGVGHRLLVRPARDGRAGYALLDGDRLEVLAATDESSATDLLAAALADGPGETHVPHVTGANQWALALGLEVGLLPEPTGYLAVRGMSHPAPYVHHGSLL